MTEGSLIPFSDILWALTVCWVLRSVWNALPLLPLPEFSWPLPCFGDLQGPRIWEWRKIWRAILSPPSPLSPAYGNSFPFIKFSSQCSSKMACIIYILKIRWTRAICSGQPSQEGPEPGFCPQSQCLTWPVDSRDLSKSQLYLKSLLKQGHAKYNTLFKYKRLSACWGFLLKLLLLPLTGRAGALTAAGLVLF